MRRWRGLKRLVHDAVDHTADLVQQSQESVARRTLGYIQLFEPAAGPARAIDQIRRISTAGVHATIHGVNHAVRDLTDGGIDAAERAGLVTASDEPPPTMRSDTAGSARWAADVALGAVNGVIGDYLHERGNELDLGMQFRQGDDYLPLEPEALERLLPEATSKLVVFVHGSSLTEWSWCFRSEEYHGDAEATFGSMMQRDLGFTPFYLRYNTGLHISDNGKELARQLDQLLEAYPGEVEELVLMGHSMGGLVIRSACHYGSERDCAWLQPLSNVFCIAAPHRGAPLEKLGNVVSSVLGWFDVPGTQIPAKVINGRSAGIKDLRFGYLTDEEWEGKDPDALLQNNRLEVPLLEDVTYAFISASLTEGSRHPLGLLIGDAMVRRPSAAGPVIQHGEFRIQTRHFGGVSHLQIQNHPDVYEQIRRICEGEEGT